MVIFSKCEVYFDYTANPDHPLLIYDFSRAKVRRSVEVLLSRLQTAYVDFYLQDRIDPKTPQKRRQTLCQN